MIYLYTGKQGAAKTLFTIADVQARAELEQREVFYSRIRGLKLPWTQIEDVSKWHECPEGALIVLDEAQDVFPDRHPASAVPGHVSPIAEARSRGHDVYLITQDPLNLDPFVRRQVNTHFHFARMFRGAEVSTVYEFDTCKHNVDRSKSGAVDERKRVFPKELYGQYESAVFHTHKVKVPPKLWIALLFLVLVGAYLWWFVSRHMGDDVPSTAQAEPVAVQVQKAGFVPPNVPVGATGELTREQWLERHQPRVPGLAYTAPVYDGVTQPARAPYPAACIQSASRCQCYTQQGTRLDVPAQLCGDIARGGFFMAWNEQGAVGAQSLPGASPVGAAAVVRE